MLEIEIVEVNIIEGGVEVFARAWRDGTQIGFGKDGSVDIERFRIYNPPVLVQDDAGDIVRIDPAEQETDTPETITRFREDPEEAIIQSIEHTISVMQNTHDDTNIIPDKRGNTTSTFYPDPAGGSVTTDGWFNHYNGNFYTAQAAASAAALTDSAAYFRARAYYSGGLWFISRFVTYFDTSAISSGDTISSATFSAYRSSKNVFADNPNDYISIVQVQGQNVVSDTAISAADYDLVGDAVDNPTEGHDAGYRLDIPSSGTGSYYDWVLNSTGISWIAKYGEEKPSGGTAGITYLGGREGYDMLDTQPPTNQVSELIFFGADTTGTSQDPKLVVEHAAAGGFAYTQAVVIA